MNREGVTSTRKALVDDALSFCISQSLDSVGIQHYIKHLQDVFAAGEEAKPAVPTSHPPAESEDDSEEEEEEDANDGEVPSIDVSRRWVIEQLARALGLPGAAPEAKQAARHFLALHAFFEVDPATVRLPSPSHESCRCCASLTTAVRLDISRRQMYSMVRKSNW